MAPLLPSTCAAPTRLRQVALFFLPSFDLEDAPADPFRDWWSDGIANESPSTTVHPSGKPMSVSHSFHVKFLATENRPIAVTALMSASLSPNRGANILCSGIPKASPTLYQKRSVSRKPFSKTGSSRRPARCSRRSIPEAFAAVRKELIGGLRSITSDKEYSLSVVGQTRIESVARKPAPQIPNLFKLVDNCFKRGPSFCAEEADDILQDKPSRPCRSSESCKVVEETTSFTLETFPVGVRVAEVLARPAGRPDFRLRDCFGVEGRDVAM